MHQCSSTRLPIPGFDCNQKFDCSEIASNTAMLFVHFTVTLSLASQTHFCKRGNGLVNCIYKPCLATLYSEVQSRCSILSHDALHHCLSSNSSLENSKRELGHLSRYCKTTSRIVFRERAYSATGNSRVDYWGHLSTSTLSKSTLTRSTLTRSTQIFTRSTHTLLSQINKVNDKLY